MSLNPRLSTREFYKRVITDLFSCRSDCHIPSAVFLIVAFALFSIKMPIALGGDNFFAGGHIFVSDQDTSSILEFDEARVFVRSWAAGQIAGARDITFGPNREFLFTASQTSPSVGLVRLGSDGSLDAFSPPELSGTTSTVATPFGTILVGDLSPPGVKEFSVNGTLLRTMPTERILGMAFAANGELLLAGGWDFILRWDYDSNTGIGPVIVNVPRITTIVVDDAGNIYCGSDDNSNPVVVKLSASYSVQGTIFVASSEVRDLGYDPQTNHILVADGTRTIKAITTSGALAGIIPLGVSGRGHGVGVALVSVCGNGILEPEEECDQGVTNSDTEPDACRTTCFLPSCGDGVVDSGEGCDDGGANANVVDVCRMNCQLPFCGDGIIDTGEQCDAGAANADNQDTCRSNCQLPICGDNIKDSGESCDDGSESSTCDDDCSTVLCGDGNVNEAAGEECDDSGASLNCDADCTFAACGDGTLNLLAGEECDDHNNDNGDTCNSDCTFPEAESIPTISNVGMILLLSLLALAMTKYPPHPSA